MEGFYRAIIEHPGYIAGRSYALHESSGQSLAPAAIDTIYFGLIVIRRALTFNGGTMWVVTGGAGSSVKTGIWANSTVSNRPLGAPLFKDDTGVATTGSGTGVALALGSGTLLPGFYWIGTKTTGTPPAVVSFPAYHQAVGYYTGLVSGTPNTHTIRYADTYSNNMPTLAEGASFTNHGAGAPMFSLTSA